jgi:hypothetical protein
MYSTIMNKFLPFKLNPPDCCIAVRFWVVFQQWSHTNDFSALSGTFFEGVDGDFSRRQPPKLPEKYHCDESVSDECLSESMEESVAESWLQVRR